MQMSGKFRVSDALFLGKHPPVLCKRRLGGPQQRSACSEEDGYRTRNLVIWFTLLK